MATITTRENIPQKQEITIPRSVIGSSVEVKVLLNRSRVTFIDIPFGSINPLTGKVDLQIPGLPKGTHYLSVWADERLILRDTIRTESTETSHIVKQEEGSSVFSETVNGLVPAPGAGITDKFLKANGTWDDAGIPAPESATINRNIEGEITSIVKASKTVTITRVGGIITSVDDGTYLKTINRVGGVITSITVTEI